MAPQDSLRHIDELHRFHDLLLGDYSSSHDFLAALLDVGREVLGISRGILGLVHGNEYEVVAYAPANAGVREGDRFPLGNSLCARVVETGDTVTLTNAPRVAGVHVHPAFATKGLKTLAAAPVRGHRRMLGTLDFCDTRAARQPFHQRHLEFLELLARAAGQALEQDTLARERSSALQRMEEHVSLFESAFNNAAFGMALVDPDFRILRVNAALCRILGYSHEELLHTDFPDITHPDDLDRDLHQVQTLLQGRADSYRMRKRYFHRNGSTVWGLLAVSIVRDPLGRPQHFVAQVEDITEQVNARNALIVRQKQLETANYRLEQLARTDALTGLANRRELLSRMELELKRRERTRLPLSVMLIDVDHFKPYNDSFGHPEGDRALKVIANRLAEACRETDLIVRYGGEEFAALLPDTRREEALHVAERMRAAVAEIDTLRRSMSASIGVSSTDEEPTPQRDMDLATSALLEAADQALYRAKNEGRNQVREAARG